MGVSLELNQILFPFSKVKHLDSVRDLHSFKPLFSKFLNQHV